MSGIGQPLLTSVGPCIHVVSYMYSGMHILHKTRKSILKKNTALTIWYLSLPMCQGSWDWATSDVWSDSVLFPLPPTHKELSLQATRSRISLIQSSGYASAILWADRQKSLDETQWQKRTEVSVDSLKGKAGFCSRKFWEQCTVWFSHLSHGLTQRKQLNALEDTRDVLVSLGLLWLWSSHLSITQDLVRGIRDGKIEASLCYMRLL